MSRRHVSPQRSDPVESDEGRVPEVEEATEDDEEGNLEMFVGTVESKLTIEEKIHTEHQSKDLTDLKLMIRSTRSVNEKMISLVESVTKRKNNANTVRHFRSPFKAFIYHKNKYLVRSNYIIAIASRNTITYLYKLFDTNFSRYFSSR